LAGPVLPPAVHGPTSEQPAGSPCRRDCLTPPANPEELESQSTWPARQSPAAQRSSPTVPAPPRRSLGSLAQRPLQPPLPDGRTEASKPAVSHRPPLRRKPDPTITPLGSYSMSGDSEPESLLLHPPQTDRHRRR
jgi:hypothetical protein